MEILRNLERNVESYLQERSKREKILLYVLCAVIGFFVVFYATFEEARMSLSEKEEIKNALNEEILTLEQNVSLDEIPKDLNDATLAQSIAELEQKIALQEKQKELLGEKFGVYFIIESAGLNHLKSFDIRQEQQNIFLSAKGKTYDVFAFLETLQAQPHLAMRSLSIYPNAKNLSLEFYLEASLYANDTKKQDANS